MSCKVTVGTAEEHAEQVFIYRDLIQQYRVFIDSPWKLIDALDLPDIEAANAHALELKHSVQMLQYALLRNEVILNNPGVAAVIAQHILQGQELSVAYDMVINSDLCDSSTAYKNINDEKLQEILLEFLQDAVYFAAMLPFPWISIPARITIGIQGVIGKDFTGRQMAWWERALGITTGVIAVVQGTGLIVSAVQDFRLARTLAKVANIAGDSNAIVTAATTAQKAGGYLEDTFTTVTLSKGTRVYGGLPGQSAFYTDLASLQASGYSRSVLWKGLQVAPHATYGYRPQIGVYEVLQTVTVAEGTALANTAISIGGYHQYYIGTYEVVLKLVDIIDLAL